MAFINSVNLDEINSVADLATVLRLLLADRQRCAGSEYWPT